MSMKKLIVFLALIAVVAVLFRWQTEKKKQEVPKELELGIEEMQKGRYAQARTAFSHAFTEDEDEVSRKYKKCALRLIAICFFEEGDYEQAEVGFLQALEIPYLSEYNGDINRYLIRCYEEKGEYDKALSMFNTVYGSDLPDDSFLERRLFLEAKAGKKDECLKDFNRWVEAKGQTFAGWLSKYRYLLYGEVGPAQILPDADSDKENKSTDSARYASLSVEDRALAVATLKKMMQLSDLKEEELLFLMDEFERFEEKEEVGKVLERLRAAGNVRAVYRLGEIAFAQDNTESAIEYLTAYNASVGRKDADGYNLLACCYAKQGKTAQALNTLNEGRFCENAGEKPELYYNEIVILEQRLDFEVAYERAVWAAEKFPENEKIAKERDFLKTRIR